VHEFGIGWREGRVGVVPPAAAIYLVGVTFDQFGS